MTRCLARRVDLRSTLCERGLRPSDVVGQLSELGIHMEPTSGVKGVAMSTGGERQSEELGDGRRRWLASPRVVAPFHLTDSAGLQSAGVLTESREGLGT